MNTKNLDTFIAVSKYASINAAAEALFISPPALQQQLNRLENEIGFRLLDRNPGGIRLTPAGTAFLGGIEKMRSGMELLLTHCREIDSMSCCIRIGAILGLHSYVRSISLHPGGCVSYAGGGCRQGSTI